MSASPVGRRRQRHAESVVLLGRGKRAWRIPFVKRRLVVAAGFLGDDTGQIGNISPALRVGLVGQGAEGLPRRPQAHVADN
jgi:hypothetical protein